MVAGESWPAITAREDAKTVFCSAVVPKLGSVTPAAIAGEFAARRTSRQLSALEDVYNTASSAEGSSGNVLPTVDVSDICSFLISSPACQKDSPRPRTDQSIC